MKPTLSLLDHPRPPQVAIVLLLLVMAVLTPRHMPAWIDEFWDISYGQNVFGHTEIAPQNIAFWSGEWLSGMFHEWLPGMFGQRWLIMLLLLSPEVRFEGQNGRVQPRSGKVHQTRFGFSLQHCLLQKLPFSGIRCIASLQRVGNPTRNDQYVRRQRRFVWQKCQAEKSVT